MKGLLRRKWILVALTVAIFLSVGTVAWAATGDENPIETAQGAFVERAKGDLPTREELKQRKERVIERQKALMGLVREKMTSEDQVAFDDLVQSISDQREAIKDAAAALKETIKELRELTDEYLEPGEGVAGPAAFSIQ